MVRIESQSLKNQLFLVSQDSDAGNSRDLFQVGDHLVLGRLVDLIDVDHGVGVLVLGLVDQVFNVDATASQVG